MTQVTHAFFGVVTKSPPLFINSAASLEAFDAAVALISERLSKEDNSTFWSDRMSTIALGLIKPSRQQFDAMKLLFEKKVPDSPKTIDLNTKTSVEVTIREYLMENNSNFTNALALAKDVSEKEEAITLSLESSTV
jgi:hypothetical protein